MPLAAYQHPSGAFLLKPEGLLLFPFVEGLLKVCHRLFQGFGPPVEVKLPLMSFWIELLLPPVHHFRVGEGSWLWSLHRSARLLLPTVAPDLGAY